MTKLVFIGTSGSVASATRDNTAFLLSAGKEQILIDCPGSIVQKLTRLKIDFRALKTVFFTHSHTDHTYGFPSLLQSQFLLNNTLNVFGHAQTCALVEKLRRAHKLTETSKYPKLRLKSIKAGNSFYSCPEFAVTAFAVSHLPGSLGYIFRFKTGCTAVITGDTAESASVIAAARDADILIHDCFSPDRIFKQYPRLYRLHTSSLQLGAIAAEAKVKKLIPIHFASEVCYSMRELGAEIRKHYQGKLIMPEDGQTLEL